MTWLDLPAHHPFGVHNLPYGVFSTGGADRRIGVRVGDHVLDLAVRDPEGNDVPIGERGEIWFKGPHLIRGYWGKPEATAETIVDGWLRSGDLGRLDEEGFV